MNKILLFHDTFLMKGGAERMNIEIAKLLGADIATAIYSRDCYNAKDMGFIGKIIEVNPRFKRGMLGFVLMKLSFFLAFYRGKAGGVNLHEYDTIFFSNEAISAVWGVKSGVHTFYYAHSISRHLFDQYDTYLAKVPKILIPFYKILVIILKKIYTSEIKKMGTIFVNSLKNKERIKEWLNRDDAITVYPPVDTQLFTKIDENTVLQTFAIEGITASYKDYYISFSRLTHAKRIDTIIEAFKQIPDKKIVILYGKNDSQREEFMRLAEGANNIIFRALNDNNNLPHIINGAIASIAISAEEDFGMVVIESMACSIPVIAVDEGGYRETMLPGKTGFLLPKENLKENLIQTINTIKKEDFLHMSESCLKRANTYSLENFKIQFLTYFR